MSFDFLPADNEFTRADAQIMEFISAHPNEFLLMNMSQLARQLGVSDATVSRFARHSGFADFKELKRAVMQQQNNQSSPALKMAQTLMKDEGGFGLAGWLSYQQSCLQKTLEHLDEDIFETSVKEILSARHIYIHAKSASASVGQLLMFRLRRLGLPVSMLPSGGSEIWEGLALAGEGDLIIMFSFSKVSREGVMILSQSRESGYKTLAFTSRLYVPAGQRADMNLFVYRGEENEYHSMAAPAAVVDALAVVAARELGPDSAKRLARLHELKKKY